MTLNVFNYITTLITWSAFYFSILACLCVVRVVGRPSPSTFFCKKVSKIFAQLLYNSNSRNLAKKKQTTWLYVCLWVITCARVRYPCHIPSNVSSTIMASSYTPCFTHACIAFVKWVRDIPLPRVVCGWMMHKMLQCNSQTVKNAIMYLCLLSVYFVKTTFEILKLNSVHSIPYE